MRGCLSIPYKVIFFTKVQGYALAKYKIWVFEGCVLEGYIWSLD